MALVDTEVIYGVRVRYVDVHGLDWGSQRINVLREGDRWYLVNGPADANRSNSVRAVLHGGGIAIIPNMIRDPRVRRPAPIWKYLIDSSECDRVGMPVGKL